MQESDYAYLYDAKAGEFDARAVRVMRTKVIRAGDSLEVEVFPVLNLNRAQQRRARRARTPQRQAVVNRRNREKRVCRLIEANFTERDIFIGLTYDYSGFVAGFGSVKEEAERYELRGLPLDYDDALGDVQRYVRRVRGRQRRTDAAEAVKYLYVIESTKPLADGLPRRYHVHMVIHAPALTRDELEGLWKSAEGRGYCNSRQLDLRMDGLRHIAGYMCKQHDARVNTSKNLKPPEVSVSDRKLSPARAASIARDVMNDGRRILESLYPGYACTQAGGPKVFFSDFLPGAYIYARMRRRQPSTGAGGGALARRVAARL